MNFFRMLGLAAGLVWTSSATAVVFNLVGPPEAVAIGAELKLNLVILNPGADARTLSIPEVIRATISDPLHCWPVELKALAPGNPVEVASGGFAVRVYQVILPPGASGALVLETTEPVAAKVAIEARAGLLKGAPVTAPLSNFVPPRTAEAAIHRTFTGRLSAHESLYFIYGDADQAAKFQFSFKYRLLGSAGPVGEILPALRRLYLGYTQRSLWDIEASSSPFYDTSYMPELMFESAALVDETKTGGIQWMGYQIGLKHESNGRTGQFSRSLNTVYFRPGVVFGRLAGWNLILAPRFHAYVGDLDDNPNLRDYRGNVEFIAAVGRNDSVALSVIGRLGRGGHKGGLQADLTIPVQADFMLDFATYFLIQYWNGHGESLLDYDRHSTTLRVGFSLVR